MKVQTTNVRRFIADAAKGVDGANENKMQKFYLAA